MQLSVKVQKDHLTTYVRWRPEGLAELSWNAAGSWDGLPQKA
jgi:hypothetical protein